LGVVQVGLFGVQVVQGLADDLGVFPAGLGRMVAGELLYPGDYPGDAAVQDV
jgi:hypothetical protein